MGDTFHKESLVDEMIDVAADADGVEVEHGYRITTVIPYANGEPEVQRYIISAHSLDAFFTSYSDTGEIVVDVRPGGEDDV